MSSSPSALLSVTYVEPGYRHVVELVHQRDPDARRRLRSLDLAVYEPEGKLLAELSIDPAEETLDLAAVTAGPAAGRPRVMAVFDARYDERIFPYRPHHYGFLHREGSSSAPLYYAVGAVLGGVPQRVDNSRINNFETYVFAGGPFAERHAVLLGNLARFAPALAQVFAYYGPERVVRDVSLPPKAHTEVTLEPEHGSRRLERVEIKGLFRMATYVTGRRATSGDLVLFDHLFTFFR